MEARGGIEQGVLRELRRRVMQEGMEGGKS